MKQLQIILDRLNDYQQKNRLIAFIIAVIKKYGEDNIGREAALLTYYGFLSIFPLLLLLTTLTNIFIGNDQNLSHKIISGLTSYFPLLGNQLSSHVHTLKASGTALIIGLLFTLYGTRGLADSFQRSIRHIWLIPLKENDGFPKSLFKSLALVIVGGVGFIMASIFAGVVSSTGHSLLIRILSLAINLLILFWLFRFIINFSLPKRIPFKDTRLGSAIAAIGLVILQTLGGYILAHELKRLDALYSYFAVALGILFWIYLQAQVLFYAIEISVVSSRKLWPRSLNTAHLTHADKKLSAIR